MNDKQLDGSWQNNLVRAAIETLIIDLSGTISLHKLIVLSQSLRLQRVKGDFFKLLDLSDSPKP